MPDSADSLRRLTALTLGLALALMIFWLLSIGRGLLMPIVVAVLSVYIITSASAALGRFRATTWMPQILRKLILLLAFTVILTAFNGVVIVTVRDLLTQAPEYQANLEQMIARGMQLLGLEGNPDWRTIQDMTIGRIDMQRLIGGVAGSVGALAGFLILIVVYAVFLFAEASGFAYKLSVALPDRLQAERTMAVIRSINARISEYLAVKTLINFVIGAISFGILWAFGVDHALFWALLIGVLNYIPYFGSLIAVAFPVLMAVVQFGSIATVVSLAALLTGAQMFVGNWLEPRMIGRKVNMSPFVVVVALSFWTTFWGVPGAILAVPLTSMLAIILAAFDQTRPISVLLAQDVSEFEQPRHKAIVAPPPTNP
ncbi:AI-2E family transporter [Pararhodobacter sp. SW119]|uniref:AI-2E family transporter n=1 Tax=Pararhodobacter sp. SW119 TaxID=2780075 RepID=UPI001AE0DD7C|nr:AI-2E family transporter [Pararhodobacter sp. SW119]